MIEIRKNTYGICINRDHQRAFAGPTTKHIELADKFEELPYPSVTDPKCPFCAYELGFEHGKRAAGKQ